MKLLPFFFSVLLFGGVRALQAAPPLPPGPLLNPVDDDVRWTVRITLKPGEDASPPKPSGTTKAKGKSGSGKAQPSVPKLKVATVSGEKSGKTVHVLSISAGGAREEKWTDGTLTAVLSAGAKEPVFETIPVEGMSAPTWVSRKNYVETREEDKKKCLVFRDRIIPANTELVRDDEHPSEDDPEKLKVDATALIDAETHLPVSVTEGMIIRTYGYEPLAADTKIIPDAIQTALTEHEEKMQEAVRAPARP